MNSDVFGAAAPARDWFTHLTMGWVEAFPCVALLVVFIGIDVFTGYIAAFIKKEVSSSASLNGMLKKVLMLAMVAVGLCMQMVYPDIPWGKVIALCFCLTEVTSIVENCSRAGVPMPAQLTDALAKLKAREKDHPIVGSVNVGKVEVKQVETSAPIPESSIH